MSKPDAIPQKVWDEALRLCERFEGEQSEDEIILVVAKAIHAERSRSLQFEFDLPAHVSHPSGSAYGRGWTDCFVTVRNYIRDGAA